MKLLYYIPSIGSPNLDIKLETINHNISYLYKQIETQIDIIINIYDEKDKIIENLEKNSNIGNINIYYKKGILAELFLTNMHNYKVKNYDYTIFCFDDVKIENINLNDMIYYKNKYNIQLLSPFIKKSTHKFMYESLETQIHLTNFLEINFLLLTKDDFELFLSIHTIENKWMWGVNFLFGYYNINSALIGNNYCEHIIENTIHDIDLHKYRLKLQNDYIKTYTKFNDFNNILMNYRFIKKSFDLEEKNEIKTYIVNLEKDKDRLTKITKNIPIKDYQVYKAFNGKNLQENEDGIKYYNIFKENNSKLSDSQIGCFVSHILLWKKMIEEKRHYMLVLEDDIHFSEHFNEVYTYIKYNIQNFNNGPLYIGGRFNKDYKPTDMNKYIKLNNYIYKYNINCQNQKKWVLHEYEYDRTTLSYIINYNIAYKLYHNFHKSTHRPVDYYLLDSYHAKNYNIYNSYPFICNINDEFTSNIK